jgi:hypothetical protein
MDSEGFDLTVRFLTPVLGTQPQRDIAVEHVQNLIGAAAAQQAKQQVGLPDVAEGLDDELATLPDQAEELTRGTTAFHRLDDGTRLLYDYMLKGFLKEAGQKFNGLRNVKNLRSKVESFVFIRPRRIPLRLPRAGETIRQLMDDDQPSTVTLAADGELTYLSRPLRAATAMGPRVSIARSELLPAGTSFVCRLEVLKGPIKEELLRDLLDYGYYQGLMQWRTGGWGRFEYDLKNA